MQNAFGPHRSDKQTGIPALIMRSTEAVKGREVIRSDSRSLNDVAITTSVSRACATEGRRGNRRGDAWLNLGNQIALGDSAKAGGEISCSHHARVMRPAISWKALCGIVTRRGCEVFVA